MEVNKKHLYMVYYRRECDYVIKCAISIKTVVKNLSKWHVYDIHVARFHHFKDLLEHKQICVGQLL